MSEPSTPLHPLIGLDGVATRIIARPGIDQACSYEFQPAFRAIHARYASAMIALGALKQPDLVAAASLHMTVPPTSITLVDAHVSAFLFGAWSTFETIVYAANAIGWSVAPRDFSDITSRKGLRAVNPHDVTKRPAYAREFPATHGAYVMHAALITLLDAQHSVSKHRHAVAEGGTVDVRSLVPGFDQLPAPLREQVTVAVIHRATWTDIILDPEPGRPHAEHVTSAGLPLDTLVRDWRAALHDVSRALRDDVRAMAQRLGV